MHSRLAVAFGDPGSLTLFGKRADRHRMISEHLTAEYRVETEGRGRKVDEWKMRPTRVDNHLFDCVVGTAVAAAIQGCSLHGEQQRKKKKKVTLAEMAARSRNG